MTKYSMILYTEEVQSKWLAGRLLDYQNLNSPLNACGVTQTLQYDPSKALAGQPSMFLPQLVVFQVMNIAPPWKCLRA
jgi:hypothetical protein